MQVIGPDDDAHARVPERLGRRAVVRGRHDHDRAAVAPFGHEGEDLVRLGQLAVDEDGVRAGAPVRLGPLQRLAQAPAGDECLDASDDAEVVVALGVLARLDLPAELVHVRERLVVADEAVGLREELVLDADAGDVACLELLDEPAHVVEVAVAGVPVEQERNRGRVAHELEQVEDLRPAHLVVVPHAHRGRDRQAAAPQALRIRPPRPPSRSCRCGPPSGIPCCRGSGAP